MNKQIIFNELLEIQRLAWGDGGDRIEQESLFELQDKLANLVLKMSEDVVEWQQKIVDEFPWLYQSY